MVFNFGRYLLAKVRNGLATASRYLMNSRRNRTARPLHDDHEEGELFFSAAFDETSDFRKVLDPHEDSPSDRIPFFEGNPVKREDLKGLIQQDIAGCLFDDGSYPLSKERDDMLDELVKSDFMTCQCHSCIDQALAEFYGYSSGSELFRNVVRDIRDDDDNPSRVCSLTARKWWKRWKRWPWWKSNFSVSHW